MGTIIRRNAQSTVVEEAHERVKKIFASELPVYFCFSGGKDSVCLADVIMKEIEAGHIDPKQMIVIFVDEEAIFPDVERVVHAWRKKFLLTGAQFWWLCLEVKHYNCFNNLASDESFICWDRNKKDVWIREPPSFAIKRHELLKIGKDTYQDYLQKLTSNGVCLIGTRVAESVQRLLNMADRFLNMKRTGTSTDNKVFPIYDWKDNDVWLYIKEQCLDFPIEYLFLYQVGTNKHQLRISQFFSVDTAMVLFRLGEYYPDLMDRVCAREPNAYIAAIYWDTEFFRRSKKGTQEKDDRDYKQLALYLLSDIETNFITKAQKRVAKAYRNLAYKFSSNMQPKHWKRLYQGLIGGDPKQRTLRALIPVITHDQKKEKAYVRKETKHSGRQSVEGGFSEDR